MCGQVDILTPVISNQCRHQTPPRMRQPQKLSNYANAWRHGGIHHLFIHVYVCMKIFIKKYL